MNVLEKQNLRISCPKAGADWYFHVSVFGYRYQLTAYQSHHWVRSALWTSPKAVM